MKVVAEGAEPNVSLEDNAIVGDPLIEGWAEAGVIDHAIQVISKCPKLKFDIRAMT